MSRTARSLPRTGSSWGAVSRSSTVGSATRSPIDGSRSTRSSASRTATRSSMPGRRTVASPSCRPTSGPACSTAGRRRTPTPTSRARIGIGRGSSTARSWRTVPTCGSRPSRSAMNCRGDSFPGLSRPALRHGSEPVHYHRLFGVRSGRQQRGWGRTLRPDRHRCLPDAAGRELRPDHHFLSREDTAMRDQRFVAPLVLAVGLSVIACTDLLNEDPKGFATTDTFFKTGADLNSATLAIYNALRGLQGQSNWTTPELASDQARADNREPNSGTYGPARP